MILFLIFGADISPHISDQYLETLLREEIYFVSSEVRFDDPLFWPPTLDKEYWLLSNENKLKVFFFSHDYICSQRWDFFTTILGEQWNNKFVWKEVIYPIYFGCPVTVQIQEGYFAFFLQPHLRGIGVGLRGDNELAVRQFSSIAPLPNVSLWDETFELSQILRCRLSESAEVPDNVLRDVLENIFNSSPSIVLPHHHHHFQHHVHHHYHHHHYRLKSPKKEFTFEEVEDLLRNLSVI